MLREPDWARRSVDVGRRAFDQAGPGQQRSRQHRLNLPDPKRVEVANTGQPDLGAQPETVSDRETMLDQPDAIHVLRDERPSNVVREIVTRVEAEHDPARSHARSVTTERENLLVRSICGHSEVDDLEALPGREALQNPLEHCAV